MYQHGYPEVVSESDILAGLFEGAPTSELDRTFGEIFWDCNWHLLQSFCGSTKPVCNSRCRYSLVIMYV